VGRKRAITRVAVGAAALAATIVALASVPPLLGDEPERNAGITIPDSRDDPEVVIARLPRPAPPPGPDLAPSAPGTTGTAPSEGAPALVAVGGPAAGEEAPPPRLSGVAPRRPPRPSPQPTPAPAPAPPPAPAPTPAPAPVPAAGSPSVATAPAAVPAPTTKARKPKRDKKARPASSQRPASPAAAAPQPSAPAPAQGKRAEHEAQKAEKAESKAEKAAEQAERKEDKPGKG
jgi:hypothetical protein